MALFVLISFVLAFRAFREGQIYHGVLGLASVLFLLIPVIVRRLSIQYPAKLYIVFFVFMILSYDFGFVYHGYAHIHHYDKLMHFLSGVLITIIGFCIYYYLRRPGPDFFEEKWIITFTYALFFSLFVAVIWEICEFAGFVLLGHDSQGTLTTGVFDTMQDLISCLAGSLISVSSYIVTVKSRVRLLTGSVVTEFYQACKD